MSTRALVALALAAALALGACGDDEGGDEEPLGDDRPADIAPEPRESVDRAAKENARAIESGECQDLFDVGIHSTKRPPKLSRADAPPSKEECESLEPYRESLRGYEPGKSRTFFSGAVVEARVDGGPASSAYVLDLDGTWKHSIASRGDPQVGSKPEADNAFDENAAKFVKAARDGDCPEVYRLLSAASEVILAAGGPRKSREQFCRELPEGSRDPRSFFARVTKDEDAKPVVLGKTRDFAFYGLAVDPGIYYTLLLARHRRPPSSEHARDGVFNWYLAKE